MLEMIQHPCSQIFSDPCIILICAPLGGYLYSLESPPEENKSSAFQQFQHLTLGLERLCNSDRTWP